MLVVDDEPDARALVARLLTSCKASVRTAASPGEAFELLRVQKPDVLIRRVRALPPSDGGNVPAPALTAYARAEDRMKAVLAGFQMHAGRAGQPAPTTAPAV